MSNVNADTGCPIRRSVYSKRDRRDRLPWPDQQSFRILSLDGGGIKGVYSAHFLAELEQRWLAGGKIGDYFDMVVGTSTGGIIALAVGIGLSATDIARIYVSNGRRVFPRSSFERAIRFLPSLFLYRYSRKELNILMQETLSNTRLGDSHVRLCIPSFDGQHGEVYVFKTPHHPDYHLDANELNVNVGAATSAAPTFFRPLQSNGYQLVDGGVWANNPVMIGLVDALSCFNIRRQQVRILSIGCGPNANARIGLWQRWGGLIAWRGVILAAMDLTSQNALGQAGLLIGRENLHRVEPISSIEIAMDDYSLATSILVPDATRAAKRQGEQIAELFLYEPTMKAEMFHTC